MTAQRLLACCWVAVVAGCGFHVVTTGSNFPDSGVVCGPDAGSGAGAISGAASFQAGAAYEHLSEVIDNDSGVVTERSVSISLTRQAFACGEAAPAGPAVVLVLFDPRGAYGTGDYVAGSQQLTGPCGCVTGPDGGRGAIVGYVDGSDGGSGARIASSGAVHVTSFGPCALSGSFDVRFTAPDGGDAGGLAGTFDPVSCGR